VLGPETLEGWSVTASRGTFQPVTGGHVLDGKLEEGYVTAAPRPASVVAAST
jgi:hypothetical protein